MDTTAFAVISGAISIWNTALVVAVVCIAICLISNLWSDK